jgi:hypothetical protein
VCALTRCACARNCARPTRTDTTRVSQHVLLQRLDAFARAHGAPQRYAELVQKHIGAPLVVDDSDASDDEDALPRAPPLPGRAFGAPARRGEEPAVQSLLVSNWHAQRGDAHECPLLRLFTTRSFPVLRHLRLSGRITPELAAAVLHACPTLRSLHLDGCKLHTEAAEALLGLPHLQEARLTAVTVETTESFADHDQYGLSLAPLVLRSRSLIELRLEKSKDLQFGPAQLPLLRELILFRLLPFGRPPLDDQELVRLTATMPELRRLAVVRCQLYGPHALTSAVLAPLASQLPLLEELHLAHTPLLEAQEHSTRDHMLLQSPTFAFPRLCILAARAAGAVTLKCPQLEALALPASPVFALPGAIAALLAATPRLVTLDVSEADGLPTDAVAALLQGATAVQSLDVSRCGFSAAHVAALQAGLPALRTLVARRSWLWPHEAAALARPPPAEGQPGARNVHSLLRARA